MIEIKNLEKSYGGTPVIKNLSLSLPESGIVCLTGPSGVGKTTFLNLLSGLQKPDSGSIEGINSRKISYLFQKDRLLPWFSVARNLQLVLPEKSGVSAEEALARIGLQGKQDKQPGQLSGGQARRVSFLRALLFLHDAPDGILLLDEPFNGLDQNTAELVLQMLSDLPEGVLTVLVSHQDWFLEQLGATVIRI